MDSQGNGVRRETEEKKGTGVYLDGREGRLGPLEPPVPQERSYTEPQAATMGYIPVEDSRVELLAKADLGSQGPWDLRGTEGTQDSLAMLLRVRKESLV